MSKRNILIKYIILLGESFKVYGVNFSIPLMIYNFIRSNKNYAIIAILSISTLYSLHLGNKPSYIGQDGFLVFVLIIGLQNYKFFLWFLRSKHLILLVYFVKWFLLYFIIETPTWGEGNLIDGNVFDFGVFKRVQIKGGDVILFFLSAAYLQSLKKHLFQIPILGLMVFSAGSRALLITFVLLLIYEILMQAGNILSKLAFSLILGIISIGVYLSPFIQARLEKDNGLGGKWRLLESLIVLEEVQQNIFFGKGLGSGFKIEIASAAPNEDGINLYTHNWITWILLKFGLIGLVLLVYHMLRDFRRFRSRDKFITILFLTISLLNNYVFTLTGAILFSSYLNYNTYDFHYHTSSKN